MSELSYENSESSLKKSHNDLSFDKTEQNSHFNELSPYIFSDEHPTNSIKQTLFESKNVIENTLKDTVEDFEKKLAKLEAELDPNYQRNPALIAKNSNCQLLDQKIDRLYAKMRVNSYDFREKEEEYSLKNTKFIEKKEDYYR